MLAVSAAAGPARADTPAVEIARATDLPIVATGPEETFEHGLEWFDTDRPDAALRMALLEEWGFQEVAVLTVPTDERFDSLTIQVQAFDDRRGAMAWHAWALRQVCDGLVQREFDQLPDGYAIKWRYDHGWTEQIAFVHGPYRVLVLADIEADRRPRDWFLVDAATALDRHVADLLGDGGEVTS